MDNSLVRLKLKQRLNKLASSDYQNLECWQEAELINTAQSQLLRRTVRDGDESTKLVIDDFNVLLKEEPLKLSNRKTYFESQVLPDDYQYFKRVLVKATREDCKKAKNIICTEVEEANVDFLLGDTLKKPSFKWGETFITFFGNKLRIWTGGDFIVKEAFLSYYQKPPQISFLDCVAYDDSTGVHQELVYKDDMVNIIINEAVKTASADINDFNNYQRSQQEVQLNK